MRSFFFFFLLCCSVMCIAQDQLFKKDNTKLEVKVLEITPTEIKYKLFSNPDGPMYSILRSEAALIIYKNGQHEAFQDAPPSVQPLLPIYNAMPPDPNVMPDSTHAREARRRELEYMRVTKYKNVIFLNAAEFLNSGVGLSYFREFFQNRIDLHVPVSFSFLDPLISGSYNSLLTTPGGLSRVTITNKDIDLGLGIYFNTSGRRAVTHFVGPLVRYVQFSGNCSTPDTYTGYGSAYAFIKGNIYNFQYRQLQFLINNGFLYRITSHFNLMINAAFGLTTSRDFSTNNPVTHTYYFPDNDIAPAFQLGFSFGYRF